MLSVMRGEKVDGLKPTLSHRMDAVHWPGDRGFGKAHQQSQVKVDDNRGGMRDVLATWTLEEVLAFRTELLAAQKALPEAQVIAGEVVEGEIRDPAQALSRMLIRCRTAHTRTHEAGRSPRLGRTAKVNRVGVPRVCIRHWARARRRWRSARLLDTWSSGHWSPEVAR